LVSTKQNTSRALVVGTRGSDLALAQTNIVIELLRHKLQNLSIKVKIIKTTGDDLRRNPNSRLTGKDSFTREIDIQLIKGEIDIAVHSLKDVPVENESNELEIVAFPKRETPLDVLISRKGSQSLRTLPPGARIGTSSLRRKVQLKVFRPDLEIIEMHGNVPSRIKKLRDGPLGLDAIILAAAGLKRLDIANEIDETISSDTVLPAVGQGCLAVMARSSDDKTKRLVKLIDDEKTRACVMAEREFSKELGGGCNTPVAAYAKPVGSRVILKGLFAGEEGSGNTNFVIKDQIEGKASEASILGRKLGRKLRSVL
jgi:hydroxymethylbilane synthase